MRGAIIVAAVMLLGCDDGEFVPRDDYGPIVVAQRGSITQYPRIELTGLDRNVGNYEVEHIGFNADLIFESGRKASVASVRVDFDGYNTHTGIVDGPVTFASSGVYLLTIHLRPGVDGRSFEMNIQPEQDDAGRVPIRVALRGEYTFRRIPVYVVHGDTEQVIDMNVRPWVLNILERYLLLHL